MRATEAFRDGHGPNLGDGIEPDGNRWSFGGSTVDLFEQHIEKSVPGYREGHALIEQLSDFFVGEETVIIELGCSTGSLIARLARRHVKTTACFLGVDIIPEMADRARRDHAEMTNLRIEEANACEIDFTDVSLVIMYYTMQFIPIHLRAPLLTRIHSQMRRGGALVLFEKTRACDGRLQDLCNQMYDGFKLEKGFSADEVVQKAKSLRGVLEPLTSDENEAMLVGAGFQRPQILYKHLAFEGVVALRSALP